MTVVEKSSHLPNPKERLKDIRIYLISTLNAPDDHKLTPIDLNDPENHISSLFNEEREKLENLIAHLSEKPIPKRDKHSGRARNKREQSDITAHRTEDIERFRFRLDVLEGKIMTPITLISKDMIHLDGIKIGSNF